MTQMVVIPPRYVPQLKPLLVPFVQAALADVTDASGAELIVDGCASASALLLALTEEDRDAQDWIEALCVLRILSVPIEDYPEPESRILQVTTLAGDRMNEWLDDVLLPGLDRIGHEQRCRGIACTGRKGWQRLLRSKGWNLIQRADGLWLMYKELDEGVQQER